MNKSIKANVAFNVIKQCCTVLFPLITYPYISRILGAAGLGRYSFADSVIQYFLILASLGISTYGIREGSIIKGNKKELNKLVKQLFTINVISSAVSLGLLLICVVSIPRFNRDSGLILLLSINIFCCLLGRDWLNTVFEDFQYLAIRYVVLHLISVGSMLILVKKPEDIYIYAGISIFAASGGYIANIFHTKKMVPYALTKEPHISHHIKPIMLLFCSAVAINIYINSDITILGFFRPNKEIGYYSLASKIYITIKGVLNAIIVAVIPRLSHYIGNNEIEKYNNLLNKLRNTLYTLILPSILGLIFLSDDVVEIVGGHEYLSSVNSLRILCGALFFAVFGCFYTQGILVPFKREKVFTKATLVSAVFNIILNLIFIPTIGIDGAAITTFIAEVTIVSISVVNTKDLKISFCNNQFKSIYIGCALIAGICLAIKSFHMSLIVELFLCVGISVIIYMIVLYIFGNDLAVDIVSKIRHYHDR